MTVDFQPLLEGMATLPYLGEPIDQLSHSLQCAALAMDAGADEELVAAALLHDVGRAREVKRGQRGRPHEEIGAVWCIEFFSDRVAWLVGAHVSAKRFLVAADEDYRARLSRASVQSLRVQGGPFDADQVAAFVGHPWGGDAARLRRWDDDAKEVGVPVPTVAGMVALLDRVRRR